MVRSQVGQARISGRQTLFSGLILRQHLTPRGIRDRGYLSRENRRIRRSGALPPTLSVERELQIELIALGEPAKVL